MWVPVKQDTLRKNSTSLAAGTIAPALQFWASLWEAWIFRDSEELESSFPFPRDTCLPLTLGKWKGKGFCPENNAFYALSLGLHVKDHTGISSYTVDYLCRKKWLIIDISPHFQCPSTLKTAKGWLERIWGCFIKQEQLCVPMCSLVNSPRMLSLNYFWHPLYMYYLQELCYLFAWYWVFSKTWNLLGVISI